MSTRVHCPPPRVSTLPRKHHGDLPHWSFVCVFSRNSARTSHAVVRCVAVLDRPLALPDGLERALLVVPPGTARVDTPHPVFALHTTSSSGACPAGVAVVYLATVAQSHACEHVDASVGALHAVVGLLTRPQRQEAKGSGADGGGTGSDARKGSDCEAAVESQRALVRLAEACSFGRVG